MIDISFFLWCLDFFDSNYVLEDVWLVMLKKWRFICVRLGVDFMFLGINFSFMLVLLLLRLWLICKL